MFDYSPLQAQATSVVYTNQFFKAPGVYYAISPIPLVADLPAVGDVRAGVNYGTNSTGTLALPLDTQVLTGIGFGAGSTEFTGNVTLPTAPQVLSGVLFGPNNTLTGTLVAGTSPKTEGLTQGRT